MEQSATTDSGLLLSFDIPEGDQVSPFSSVIWLTWRHLLRWSADVCIELCNSFISRFCKVPPQLCDGSTVIHDICSIVEVVVVVVVVDAQGRDAEHHLRLRTSHKYFMLAFSCYYEENFSTHENKRCFLSLHVSVFTQTW